MAFKWYTRSRKFPQLVGRTPDGTRIPGGPYTYSQVIVAAVMAFVLSQTTVIWARAGLITNAVMFVGLIYGVIYLVGKLPPGLRNPIVMLNGFSNLAKKSGYRMAGQSVPERKPKVVSGYSLVFEATEALAGETTVEVVDVASTSGTDQQAQTSPMPAPPLSAVQRLLLERSR